MSDKKKVLATTPIGETKWFSVSKTDKFGNFTAELHIDESEKSMKFVDFLQEFGEGRKPLTKTEQGYMLKLKAKSAGVKKSGESYTINPPVIYSNAGAAIQGAELEKLNIGNGSKIRAKIEVEAYDYMGTRGVAVRLKSVQIVEAIAFESNNSHLGFDPLDMEPNAESDEQKESFEEQSDNYDF